MLCDRSWLNVGGLSPPVKPTLVDYVPKCEPNVQVGRISGFDGMSNLFCKQVFSAHF